jgi:hypothetical protein
MVSTWPLAVVAAVAHVLLDIAQQHAWLMLLLLQHVEHLHCISCCHCMPICGCC